MKIMISNEAVHANKYNSYVKEPCIVKVKEVSLSGNVFYIDKEEMSRVGSLGKSDQMFFKWEVGILNEEAMGQGGDKWKYATYVSLCFILFVLVLSFCANSATDLDVLRANTEAGFKRVDTFATQVNKRAIMNSNNIASLTNRVVTNTNDISYLKANKVDKAVFVADQKRQDTNLANETLARIEGDKRNEKDLANISNQVTNVQGDIKGVKNDTENETQERKNVDSQLSGRIDTKLDTSIYEQYVTQQGDVNHSLSDSIAQYQSTSEYALSHIDEANANIEANNQAIQSTNKRAAQNTADIAQQGQRIQSLEKSTNANFSALRDEVRSNKKRADAGTASVAAMANIPQVTEYGRFSLGVGVGARGQEKALAVGISSRISGSVLGKVSVSSDTQSKLTIGAGVAMQW